MSGGRGGGHIASTFWEAKRFLSSARSGRTYRPVRDMKSTQIEENPDGSLALRYHDTQVVIYHPDGTFTISHGDVSSPGRRTKSGGQAADVLPTVTTRGRIENNSPARVYSDHGQPKIQLKNAESKLPAWLEALGFTPQGVIGQAPWYGETLRVDFKGNPIPAAVLKSLWPAFRDEGVREKEREYRSPRVFVWPWERPVPGDAPAGQGTAIDDVLAVRRRLDGTLAARIMTVGGGIQGEIVPKRWEEPFKTIAKSAKEAQKSVDAMLLERDHSFDLLTLRQFIDLLESSGPTMPGAYRIKRENEAILSTKLGDRKIRRMHLQIPYEITVLYEMGRVKARFPFWEKPWPGPERDIVCWFELDDKSAVGLREDDAKLVRAK